jgi:8-oxo-dGTP pyrophosphatase MutT (NUDIX family)
VYDEYFTIVGPVNPRDPESRPIVPYGAVARELAHSSFRVPHAAVHVLPVRMGTGEVLLHRRSARVRVGAGVWDTVGGHVAFELGMPLTAEGLSEASFATALRELREELLLALDGQPYVAPPAHLRRVGAVGALQSGLDDPTAINVEYSTLYVAAIPSEAQAQQLFELRDGSLREWLAQEALPWPEVVARFHEPASPCGDALARILRHTAADPGLAAELDAALSWCRSLAPAPDVPEAA